MRREGGAGRRTLESSRGKEGEAERSTVGDGGDCPAIAKVAGVFLDPITRHRPELSLAEALQASGTLPAGPRAPRTRRRARSPRA